MKKTLLLTTALTFGAISSAFAGGMAEPVMDPVVVTEQTSSSSQDIIIPILLLLVIAAAASSNSPTVQLSDMRLKEDIRRVGTTHLGLPLYQYRYIGMPGVWEGVMAQDVEIMHPNAIKQMPFGYKAVDYGALGLKVRAVH